MLTVEKRTVDHGPPENRTAKILYAVVGWTGSHAVLSLQTDPLGRWYINGEPRYASLTFQAPDDAKDFLQIEQDRAQGRA